MEARSCDSEIFSKSIRTTYTLWYTRRDTVAVLWRSSSCKKASLCLCTSPEWQWPVASNLQFILRWHIERNVVFRNFGCQREKRRKLKTRGQNPSMQAPTYFREYGVSLRRERNEWMIYLMPKTWEVFTQSSEPEAHVKNARQTKKYKTG